MAKVNVLIEVKARQEGAFSAHAAAMDSTSEATNQAEQLLNTVQIPGVEIVSGFAPVPLFGDSVRAGLAAFASPTTNPDQTAESMVVAARVDSGRLEEIKAAPGVKVYPNSELNLFQSSGWVDVRPFTYRPAVPIGTIRALLGTGRVWRDGFYGQDIIVGIVDEGINGIAYPVAGGFSQSAIMPPGAAPVTSHGSMCAASVLISAPGAQLYDYPFLGIPDSGGVITMYHEILEQRRKDGTPHLTNNSFGVVGEIPVDPNHEVNDLDHPLHRKIREVVASGAPTFFAAGNCGIDSPSSVCGLTGTGPGRSIHGPNSLKEVITIAAVNSRHERIGYSSQGPGMFEPSKPDLAAYSHFLANFGPGRPGGIAKQIFDNGTSAASPLAAGVGALLMSAIPGLTPARLKEALIAAAIPLGVPGWNGDTGHGIINAAAAYAFLRR